MLNLLGNALKFTTCGAVELRLQSTANGSVLRIEVVDTGPGVPVGQRERLFQAFERADTDATRFREGAGLGLSIAARLVLLMAGRLGHDDKPGGGSVFWFELPRGDVTDADAVFGCGGDPATVKAMPDARQLRILVVDDVLMNRDIAGAFLRAGGHAVICAEGGAQAVAAVDGSDFDVVLMDVRMPGMDGLEATRRIRALEGARGRVPIVALTAQAFTEQIAACREAGMDSHLAKPFDVAGLLETVERATRPAMAGD
jgi:CheY-like chemotaxis protein